MSTVDKHEKKCALKNEFNLIRRRRNDVAINEGTSSTTSSDKFFSSVAKTLGVSSKAFPGQKFKFWVSLEFHQTVPFSSWQVDEFFYGKL